MLRIVPLVLLAIVVSTTSAWPQMVAMIPNSKTVADGTVNLGHAEGSILAHQFGRDFNVGRLWTKELCLKDSDNDGQTNGQELGDPCCVWSIGRDDVLQRINGTSNPGNASSLSNPSLWKGVDCAVYQLKAATPAASNQTSAPATTTPAPTATTTTPAPTTTKGVSPVPTVTKAETPAPTATKSETSVPRTRCV